MIFPVRYILTPCSFRPPRILLLTVPRRFSFVFIFYVFAFLVTLFFVSVDCVVVRAMCALFSSIYSGSG